MYKDKIMEEMFIYNKTTMRYVVIVIAAPVVAKFGIYQPYLKKYEI